MFFFSEIKKVIFLDIIGTKKSIFNVPKAYQVTFGQDDFLG